MAIRRLFNSHDVAEQIDVLRRAVRGLIQMSGPVPPELAADHDWDFEVREADRLAKEADLAAHQAEQAKAALAAAEQHAKEVSKPPAQKAADMAHEKAKSDLEAKVAAAQAAAEAAKAAHAEAGSAAKASAQSARAKAEADEAEAAAKAKRR